MPGYHIFALHQSTQNFIHLTMKSTIWRRQIISLACLSFIISNTEEGDEEEVVPMTAPTPVGTYSIRHVKALLLKTTIRAHVNRFVMPQSHWLYGGRTVAVELQNRVISAVAAGPPYGESLCFTGRKGGRRIIARSYNFFHFYVRRRNLSHRSHAVDASTATIRRTYGGRTEALRQSVASVWPHGRRTAAVRLPYGPLALRMP